MGKIYYIMGKSSSGKDTLFRKIKQELPMLQTVTLYTTRPKREGEREGVEYHFVTDEQISRDRERLLNFVLIILFTEHGNMLQ